MQVNQPVVRDKLSVGTNLTNEAVLAHKYSPNARERAAVNAAARRYNPVKGANSRDDNGSKAGSSNNFAEPLSDFDKYLIQGFENDDDNNTGNNRNDVSHHTNFNNISFNSVEDSFEMHHNEDFNEFTPNTISSHRTHIEFDDENNESSVLDRSLADGNVYHKRRHGSEIYITGLPDKLPYEDLNYVSANNRKTDGDDYVGVAGENYDNTGSLEEFEYDGTMWNIYQTDEGHYYYLNSLTYHSQWYDPREYGYIDENSYANEGLNEECGEVSTSSEPQTDEAIVPPSDPAPRHSPSASPSKSPQRARKHFSPARIAASLRTDKLFSISSSDSEDDDARNQAAATAATIRTNKNNKIKISGTGSMISAERLGSGIPGHIKTAVFTKPSNVGGDFDTEYVDEAHVNSDWDKVPTPKHASGVDHIRKLHQQYTLQHHQKLHQWQTEPPASEAHTSPASTVVESSFVRPPPIVISKPRNDETMASLAADESHMVPTKVTNLSYNSDSDHNQQQLSKFMKMKNIGIPLDSIVSQMRAEDVDEALVERVTSGGRGSTPRRTLNKKEKLSPTPRNSGLLVHSGNVSASELHVAGIVTPTSSGVVDISSPSPIETIVSPTGAGRSRVWDTTPVVGMCSQLSPMDVKSPVNIEESERDEFQKLFGRTASSETLLSLKITRQMNIGKQTAIAVEPLLIDKKRAQVIVVGLIAFKAIGTLNTVCSAICSLDNLNHGLRIENLDSFMSLLPTPSELSDIQSDVGNVRESRHPAEEFLVCAAAFCPALTRRLRHFIACESFVVRAESVVTGCATLVEMCRRVMNS
jgi:hypothetical protein